MNNLDIFQGVGQAPKASSSMFGLTGDSIMMVLLVVFVVVIGYIVIGKALPSVVPNVIPMSTSVYWKSKRVWPPSGTTMNLTSYPKDFGTLSDVSYSFNMDLVLKDTRADGTSGLHRHIFHRGSEEYASSSPPSTLPRRMNPGIFLDPLTNDLLIFVDTLGGSTGYRESLRIPDIPLSIPFQLGIVLNNRTLDVYLNCRLEETKLLQGTPKTVENRLYGIAGPSSAPAQLQNVYCWNSALSSNEMTSLCRGVPSFTLTPTCGVKPVASGDTYTGVDASAFEGVLPSTLLGKTNSVASGLFENATSKFQSIANERTNIYRS
jgi:hypothetical protein